jgi:hypothetical protein
MCRFYSIRLWHSLLAVGPTGILPVILAMQFSTPNSANKIPTAFDFRWSLKDTDTE